MYYCKSFEMIKGCNKYISVKRYILKEFSLKKRAARAVLHNKNTLLEEFKVLNRSN